MKTEFGFFKNTTIDGKRVKQAEIDMSYAHTVKLRFGDVVEVTMSNADVHELIRLLTMNVPIDYSSDAR